MTKAQETAALLKEIIRRMVSNPGAVEVGHQISEEGDAYFTAKVAPADEPILIGYRGAHVRALKLLVANVGLRTASRRWNLRAITPSAPGSPRRDFPVDAVKYNPDATLALFSRTVTLAGFQVDHCNVKVPNGPKNELSFVFSVVVDIQSEYAALVSNPDELKGEFGDSPLIAALGDLFRAIGRNDGVRFNVAAVRPLAGPVA